MSRRVSIRADGTRHGRDALITDAETGVLIPGLIRVEVVLDARDKPYAVLYTVQPDVELTDIPAELRADEQASAERIAKEVVRLLERRGITL